MNLERNKRSMGGFTLVELAIVMIIIGLLIAGILKGQELIGNAKVTSQVAQIKGIDAAVSTFKDMYSALPGDMLNPSGRLPNCATIGTQCSTPGSGDGNLANDLTTVPAAATEGGRFFSHLTVADLITGIDPKNATIQSWGAAFPAAKINGGIFPGSSNGSVGGFSSLIGGQVPNSGLYLGLSLSPSNAAPTVSLTPNQAQRVDSKIDDGVPGSGSVRAFGGSTCASATLYAEDTPGQLCGVYIRIQG